ncbi:hypothetical protein [Haloarchaeobius litoreus]|uniref:RNA ligase domain-containing protein n=1 Tax=Haloarchaeobius litoreus TaxID=755306 RepID=A0ABD6DHV8_9EURY|nr:hypothetical protein [Haloarchaeobius litoreus]
MDEPPTTPPLADAPAALLDGGHLWLREHVTGSPLRFQLQPSGVLAFGDDDSEFASDDVPLPYAHAVRHVRERFDREAFRASVDDVASVTFVGVAVDGSGVAYDWVRTPSFLGTEVYDADHGSVLPPDSVASIYEGLGLAPVNALAKEVRAVDFDPEGYAFPDSNWRDGPVAGVLLADKTGHRAVLRNPAVTGGDGAPDTTVTTPDELVERHATDRWLDSVVARLGVSEDELGFDLLFERAVEALAREQVRAFRDGSVDTDEATVRSAMADRVESYLVARRE